MKYRDSFLVSILTTTLLVTPAFAGPSAQGDDKPEVHGTIVPNAAGLALGAKDFTNDLPQELRLEKVETRTATIKVDKKVAFEVVVHYDQLVSHPNYYRRAEVYLPKPLPGVTVGVVFGFPTNLGTIEKPLMAVPMTLQWAGEGWLRGEQWTLYADGRLLKTE